MLRISITKTGFPTQTSAFDKREISVGRTSANDLVIAEPGVSGNHARILCLDHELTVIDLDSTNGTFVNGARIQGPHIVQPGDEIYICTHRLTFAFDPPSAGAPSPSYPPSLGFGSVPAPIGSPSQAPVYPTAPPQLSGHASSATGHRPPSFPPMMSEPFSTGGGSFPPYPDIQRTSNLPPPVSVSPTRSTFPEPVLASPAHVAEAPAPVPEPPSFPEFAPAAPEFSFPEPSAEPPPEFSFPEPSAAPPPEFSFPEPSSAPPEFSFPEPSAAPPPEFSFPDPVPDTPRPQAPAPEPYVPAPLPNPPAAPKAPPRAPASQPPQRPQVPAAPVDEGDDGGVQRRSRALEAVLQQVGPIATAVPGQRQRVVEMLRTQLGADAAWADRMAEELFDATLLSSLADEVPVMLHGPRHARTLATPSRAVDAEFSCPLALELSVRRATGRPFDETHSVVNVRLPDGCELNAVHQTIAHGGPIVVVYPPAALDPANLGRLSQEQALSPGTAGLLTACAQGGLNVLIASLPGADPVPLLAAMAHACPGELRQALLTTRAGLGARMPSGSIVLGGALPQDQAVPRTTVAIAAASLGLDRVWIDDVAGPEASALASLVGGVHCSGALCIRAESAEAALDRLAGLLALSGSASLEACRRNAAQTFALVVVLLPQPGGRFTVAQVAEPRAHGNGAVELHDLVRFDVHRGQWARTQASPSFAQALQLRGISFDANLP